MKELFENKGINCSGILSLSPREANELCSNGAIIVDVREEYMNQFKIFDVDEIIFCPRTELESNYQKLPKDKALIFADATGIHSKTAIKFLMEKGFKNIAILGGGIVEWERSGMPITIDKSECLSGSCACMLRKREKNK